MLNGVEKVYKDFDKVCIFQPHRISRLKDLRREFSYAFTKADIVILCPIYSAGEKIKLGFSYFKFAKEIIQNSKVKLFMVNDLDQLAKFLKNNMSGKKLLLEWELEVFQTDEKNSTINQMNINQLKDLLFEFGNNVKFEYDLKKKTGLILEEKPKFFIRQIT